MAKLISGIGRALSLLSVILGKSGNNYPTVILSQGDERLVLPFIVGDKRKPAEIVALINKWKESKKPIRVIVSDGPINLMMAIMAFPWKKQENTGDLYYTLSLKAYKDLNTSMTADDAKAVDDVTGLKDRPTINNKPSTATLHNKGADILDAAKKAYGNYKHYERIIQSNDLKNLAINNLSQLRKLKVK